MGYFHHFNKNNLRTDKQMFREKFENFVSDLKIRGMSDKTIDVYVYYNGCFFEFVKKEPRCVSSVDIRRYLNHLVSKGVKARTINMALNSLKAYYEGFLGKRLSKGIRRAKLPKDMPRILSKEEIKEMILQTDTVKHKLLIELLYSSGIRVSEAVKVKVNDLDINQGILFVKKGKGSKDRFTIVSRRFVKDLGSYSPKSEYLFDNGRSGHITSRTAEVVLKAAAKKAGIKQRVYPHLLRASFATHLLEGGVGLDKVQKLLGHESIRTTMAYIKTRTDDLKKIKSPLD